MENGIFTKITSDPEVVQFLQLADQHLGIIGLTEHGFRHARLVGNNSARILTELGYSAEDVELARIAGYLHDVGNFVCRANHAQTGAILLFPLIRRYIDSDYQAGLIISAIGNHEEDSGQVSHAISAAVVLADKSDVHRSRVRHYDPALKDIHDQVNYSVTKSKLEIDSAKREIRLELELDSEIATVMDYFNIFLSRMTMCQSAAEILGCRFHITCNGAVLE
jgi:uncharacterized protein